MAYTSLQRSINAKKQLRDRHGRWVDMGGSIKALFAGVWRAAKVRDIRDNKFIVEFDEPYAGVTTAAIDGKNVEGVASRARLGRRANTTKPVKARISPKFNEGKVREKLAAKGVDEAKIDDILSKDWKDIAGDESLMSLVRDDKDKYVEGALKGRKEVPDSMPAEQRVGISDQGDLMLRLDDEDFADPADLESGDEIMDPSAFRDGNMPGEAGVYPVRDETITVDSVETDEDGITVVKGSDNEGNEVTLEFTPDDAAVLVPEELLDDSTVAPDPDADLDAPEVQEANFNEQAEQAVDGSRFVNNKGEYYEKQGEEWTKHSEDGTAIEEPTNLDAVRDEVLNSDDLWAYDHSQTDNVEPNFGEQAETADEPQTETSNTLDAANAPIGTEVSSSNPDEKYTFRKTAKNRWNEYEDGSDTGERLNDETIQSIFDGDDYDTVTTPVQKKAELDQPAQDQSESGEQNADAPVADAPEAEAPEAPETAPAERPEATPSGMLPQGTVLGVGKAATGTNAEEYRTYRADGSGGIESSVDARIERGEDKQWRAFDPQSDGDEPFATASTKKEIQNAVKQHLDSRNTPLLPIDAKEAVYLDNEDDWNKVPEGAIINLASKRWRKTEDGQLERIVPKDVEDKLKAGQAPDGTEVEPVENRRSFSYLADKGVPIRLDDNEENRALAESNPEFADMLENRRAAQAEAAEQSAQDDSDDAEQAQEAPMADVAEQAPATDEATPEAAEEAPKVEGTPVSEHPMVGVQANIISEEEPVTISNVSVDNKGHVSVSYDKADGTTDTADFLGASKPIDFFTPVDEADRARLEEPVDGAKNEPETAGLTMDFNAYKERPGTVITYTNKGKTLTFRKTNPTRWSYNDWNGKQHEAINSQVTTQIHNFLKDKKGDLTYEPGRDWSTFVATDEPIGTRMAHHYYKPVLGNMVDHVVKNSDNNWYMLDDDGGHHNYDNSTMEKIVRDSADDWWEELPLDQSVVPVVYNSDDDEPVSTSAPETPDAAPDSDTNAPESNAGDTSSDADIAKADLDQPTPQIGDKVKTQTAGELERVGEDEWVNPGIQQSLGGATRKGTAENPYTDDEVKNLKEYEDNLLAGKKGSSLPEPAQEADDSDSAEPEETAPGGDVDSDTEGAPEAATEPAAPLAHPLDAFPDVIRRTPEALEGEKYPPNQEQQDVIDAVLGGLDTKVSAAAGSGKTSTLEALARRIQKENPDARILYLVFNKSMQEEATKRMPDNVEVRTGHSLAFQEAPKWMTDRLKAKDVVSSPKDLAKFFNISKVDKMDADNMARLSRDTLNKYANSGDDEITLDHVPDRKKSKWDEEEPEPYSDAVKAAAVENAKKMWADITSKDGKMRMTHDYYRKYYFMSDPDLSKGGKKFKAADYLFVDEYQDTQRVLERLVNAQNIQKVLVGDPDQEIYGSFTGSIDALSVAEADVTLPLVTSYRFGKNVADWGNRALQLVGSLKRVIGGGPEDGEIGEIDDPDAILNRTNAGALKNIFQNIAAGKTVGVPPKMKGDLRSLTNSMAWLLGEKGKPAVVHDDVLDYPTLKDMVVAAQNADSPDPVASRLLDLFNFDPDENPHYNALGIHSASDMLKYIDQIYDPAEDTDVDPFEGYDLDDDGILTFPEDKWGGFKLRGKLLGKKHGMDQFSASKLKGPQYSLKEFGLINKKDDDGNWQTFVAGDTAEERLATLDKIRDYLGYSLEPKEVDITVSTAHKSKGLEWDKVRIGDDFFAPDPEKNEGPADIDPEEHRLAYVALTRAKTALDPGSLSWIENYTDENGGDPDVGSYFDEPDAPESDSLDDIANFVNDLKDAKQHQVERDEHANDDDTADGNVDLTPDDDDTAFDAATELDKQDDEFNALTPKLEKQIDNNIDNAQEGDAYSHGAGMRYVRTGSDTWVSQEDDFEEVVDSEDVRNAVKADPEMWVWEPGPVNEEPTPETDETQDTVALQVLNAKTGDRFVNNSGTAYVKNSQGNGKWAEIVEGYGWSRDIDDDELLDIIEADPSYQYVEYLAPEEDSFDDMVDDIGTDNDEQQIAPKKVYLSNAPEKTYTDNGDGTFTADWLPEDNPHKTISEDMMDMLAVHNNAEITQVPDPEPEDTTDDETSQAPSAPEVEEVETPEGWNDLSDGTGYMFARDYPEKNIAVNIYSTDNGWTADVYDGNDFEDADILDSEAWDTLDEALAWAEALPVNQLPETPEHTIFNNAPAGAKAIQISGETVSVYTKSTDESDAVWNDSNDQNYYLNDFYDPASGDDAPYLVNNAAEMVGWLESDAPDLFYFNDSEYSRNGDTWTDNFNEVEGITNEQLARHLMGEPVDWLSGSDEPEEITPAQAEEIVNDLINVPDVGDPADHPVGAEIHISDQDEVFLKYRKTADSTWNVVSSITGEPNLNAPRTDEWIKNNLLLALADGDSASLVMPADPDDITPQSGFSIGDIVVSTKNKPAKVLQVQNGKNGTKLKVQYTDGQISYMQPHLTQKASPEQEAYFFLGNLTNLGENSLYGIKTDTDGNNYVTSASGDNIYVGDIVSSTGATAITGEVVGFTKDGTSVKIKDSKDGTVKPRKLTKVYKESSAEKTDETTPDDKPIEEFNAEDAPVGSTFHVKRNGQLRWTAVKDSEDGWTLKSSTNMMNLTYNNSGIQYFLTSLPNLPHNANNTFTFEKVDGPVTAPQAPNLASGFNPSAASVGEKFQMKDNSKGTVVWDLEKVDDNLWHVVDAESGEELTFLDNDINYNIKQYYTGDDFVVDPVILEPLPESKKHITMTDLANALPGSRLSDGKITYEKHENGHWFDIDDSSLFNKYDQTMLYSWVENGPNWTLTPASEVSKPEPVAPSGIKKREDFSTSGQSMGGTNGGSVATYIPTGEEYYIKPAHSDDHAHTEVLAAQIYDALGVKTATYEYLEQTDGSLGVASKMFENTGSSDFWDKVHDPDFQKKMQEGFAADVLLANWDVAGTAPTANTLIDNDGNPVRLDFGGTLKYRATGAEKPDFGTNATEWDSLRDPWTTNAAKLFKNMSDEDLKNSARKLFALTNDKIDQILAGNSKMTPEQRLEYRDLLRGRRDDIFNRAGLTDEWNALKAENTNKAPEANTIPGKNGEALSVGSNIVWENKGVEGVLTAIDHDSATVQMRLADGTKKWYKAKKMVLSPNQSESVDATPPAGTPDFSTKPEMPELTPVPEDSFYTPGMLDKMEERYKNFQLGQGKPEDSIKKLEQSYYWTSIKTYGSTGNPDTLENIRNKGYIDDEMYNELVAHREAIQKQISDIEADNAAKLAEYQEAIKQWVKDNNLTSSVMDRVSPRLTEADEWTEETGYVLNENGESVVDWSKGPAGTLSLQAAMSDLDKDLDIGTHGLSVAVDSSDLVDMNVRLYKVEDVDGKVKTRIQMWAHKSASNTIRKNLDRVENPTDMDFLESAGYSSIHPSLHKLSATKKSGGPHGALSGVAGKADVFKGTTESGVEVRLRHYDPYHHKKGDKNTGVMADMIDAVLPENATPQHVEEVLKLIGVKKPHPADRESVDFHKKKQIVTHLYQWVGDKSTKYEDDPSKMDEYVDIALAKYDATLDDFQLSLTPLGYNQFKVSDRVKKKMHESKGAGAVYHNTLGSGADWFNPDKDPDGINYMLRRLAHGQIGAKGIQGRYFEGDISGGMSWIEDFTIGGGKYLFMSVADANYVPKPPLHDSNYGNYTFVAKADVMFEYLGNWANTGDGWGARKEGSSFMSNLPYSGNEFMMLHGLSVDQMWYVIVPTKAKKAALIKALNNLGIFSMNGVALEEFILGPGDKKPSA